MTNEGRQQNRREKLSPDRLLKAVDVVINTWVSRIERHGMENLDLLGPDEPVIIATSHISDVDVPLAISVMGRELDVMVTNQSVHHSFMGEPSTHLGLLIAGKENFLPIEYNKTATGKEGAFNPSNFVPMADAITAKKSIIVAAHSPTFGSMAQEGLAAVYLAQVTGARVLPFAASLGKREWVRQPADVSLNRPIKLEPIPGIDALPELYAKMKSNEYVDADQAEWERLIAELRKQSYQVMNAIADLLPEDKRGGYGNFANV